MLHGKLEEKLDDYYTLSVAMDENEYSEEDKALILGKMRVLEIEISLMELNNDYEVMLMLNFLYSLLTKYGADEFAFSLLERVTTTVRRTATEPGTAARPSLN